MSFSDTRQLVQVFDDDEAVWRAFSARKRLRDILGPEHPLTGEIADALDWIWAERHAGPLRAIGIPMP